MNMEEAIKAIKNAWLVSFMSGAVTLVLVILSLWGVDPLGVGLWSWVDVILIAGLAIGIYLKSRVCAVLTLIYFVGNRIFLLAETGKPSGIFWGAVISYYLFQGIRGTFAYQRLIKEAKAAEVTQEPTTI